MRTLLTDPLPPTMRSEKKIPKPRLGFLGIGWNAHLRMQAIVRNGLAEITAIVDTSAEPRERVAAVHCWKKPWSRWISKTESLFNFRADGNFPPFASQ